MRKLTAFLVAIALLAGLSPAGAACWNWSLTASANGSADPTINFAEGQSPSSVNDSARALMARLAECRDDLSGKLQTAGTSTAYTLTTNQGFAAVPQNGQAVSFRPHATNGTSPTMVADGGTVYPIQSSPGVAVASGVLVLGSPYTVTFSSGDSAWLLRDFYALTVNLDQFGSTRGSILERGASGWTGVIPGLSGTVWTSGGSGADPSYQWPTVVTPQGYLTATTAQPSQNGDFTAATRLFYTPTAGNKVPIYNGTAFVAVTFAELTLDLGTGQAANTIYDVCIFLDTSTVRAGFTPAWATSTAAGGTRGTAAGGPQLVNLTGLAVNNYAITVNNGATTYSVAANQCTYVGSVLVDGSAGQVSGQRSWGSSRKWGVWNAYNQRPIILKAGDSTASWVYGSATVRAARAQTSNSIIAFTGLSTPIKGTLRQQLQMNVANAAQGTMIVGICYNVTNAFSGLSAKLDISTSATSYYGATVGAEYVATPTSALPVIGQNTFTACESSTAPGTGSNTFRGTEADMLLTVEYPG